MYEALSTSVDEELSAIAQKSLKEVKYHYTHTSSWMRIFAQGTEESRERLINAIENIWEYTKGLFAHVEGEEDLIALNIAPNTDELYQQFIVITKMTFRILDWNIRRTLLCSLNPEPDTIQNTLAISFVNYNICKGPTTVCTW